MECACFPFYYYSFILTTKAVLCSQHSTEMLYRKTTLFCFYPCTIQRTQWQPTPVLLPGKSHRQRSLVSCSPWGREESETTERLHFHFSLSFIGEGNGNPFQCSCLENPRDGRAWWAAVYGVAQSRTRLKRLSSSTHMHLHAYIYNGLSLSHKKNEIFPFATT